MKSLIKESGRIIIGVLLLTFLIGWAISTYQRVWDLRFIHDIDMNLTGTVKYILYSFLFIRPILLILGLFGLFIKNVFGWVLMTAFFYYITFEYMFVTIPKNGREPTDYLIIPILLTPVIIANLPPLRRQFEIDNGTLINANLGTLCLGIVTAFVQGYMVVNHDIGIYEILERIN